MAQGRTSQTNVAVVNLPGRAAVQVVRTQSQLQTRESQGPQGFRMSRSLGFIDASKSCMSDTIDVVEESLARNDNVVEAVVDQAGEGVDEDHVIDETSLSIKNHQMHEARRSQSSNNNRCSTLPKGNDRLQPPPSIPTTPEAPLGDAMKRLQALRQTKASSRSTKVGPTVFTATSAAISAQLRQPSITDAPAQKTRGDEKKAKKTEPSTVFDVPRSPEASRKQQTRDKVKGQQSRSKAKKISKNQKVGRVHERDKGELGGGLKSRLRQRPPKNSRSNPAHDTVRGSSKPHTEPGSVVEIESNDAIEPTGAKSVLPSTVQEQTGSQRLPSQPPPKRAKPLGVNPIIGASQEHPVQIADDSDEDDDLEVGAVMPASQRHVAKDVLREKLQVHTNDGTAIVRKPGHDGFYNLEDLEDLEMAFSNQPKHQQDAITQPRKHAATPLHTEPLTEQVSIVDRPVQSNTSASEAKQAARQSVASKTAIPAHRPFQTPSTGYEHARTCLVNDTQAKRSSIISFSRSGPRNQGISNVTATPGPTFTAGAVKRKRRLIDQMSLGSSVSRSRAESIHHKPSTTQFLPARAADEQGMNIEDEQTPTLLTKRVRDNATTYNDPVHGLNGVFGDESTIFPRSSPLMSRSQAGNARLLRGVKDNTTSSSTNVNQQIKAAAKTRGKWDADDLGYDTVSRPKRLKADVSEHNRSPSPQKASVTPKRSGVVKAISVLCTTPVKPPLANEVVAVNDSLVHFDSAINLSEQDQSTVPRVTFRSNSKPIPAPPEQASRALTGSTTLMQIDKANAAFHPTVVESKMFDSPLRAGPTYSPFLQRLTRIMNQHHGQSNRVCEPVPSEDSSSDSGEDEPATPDDSTEKSSVGSHRDNEAWLEDLSPELAEIYRALQDVNKHIVLELDQSAKIVDGAIEQYQTNTVGLIQLFEQHKKEHMDRLMKRNEIELSTWAREEMEILSKQHEQVGKLACDQGLRRWHQNGSRQDGLLNMLHLKLGDGAGKA